MKTFPVWEPSGFMADERLVEAFKNHQEVLKKHIDASQEFIEKGIVISSPANKYVVYTLEAAFDIIVSHEKRHLEQAKEAYQLLQKGARQ